MGYYVDTIGQYGLGNIDLNNRIVVHNPDGSISTECSFSVEFDGLEVLLPTVINGQIRSQEYAIDYYLQTGEYLGKFATVQEADEYAARLHERQDWYYGGRGDHMRAYKYTMGIMVNGMNIPDPSEWNYQVGDLDTSGKRDATGLLHRAYVATKINYEFNWKSLDWEMLQMIVGAVQNQKFQLTAPDPRTFNTMYTGDYYVGDRTGKCLYYLPEKPDVAQFDLKLKFIEY